jgi:hypothetical protein
MLEKDFTPHPEDLELKGLGFDEECLGYYNIDPYFKNPSFRIGTPFDHQWLADGGMMTRGGNIDEISSNMEAIRKAFPNAKVSYSFAKNGDGTNYVIRAKENGKIVYSSYVPKYAEGGMMADGGAIKGSNPSTGSRG